jgi:hypothetical protein
MIRVFLGSALSLGGVALATMLAGPDLVTGVNGAPMIVHSEDRVSLEAALFDGDTCASTLLYGENPEAGGEPAGIRLVALGLRADGDIIELGMRDTPGMDGAPRAVVAVLFDEAGRLVAVSKPEALIPAAAGACGTSPATTDRSPI